MHKHLLSEQRLLFIGALKHQLPSLHLLVQSQL